MKPLAPVTKMRMVMVICKDVRKLSIAAAELSKRALMLRLNEEVAAKDFISSQHSHEDSAGFKRSYRMRLENWSHVSAGMLLKVSLALVH